VIMRGNCGGSLGLWPGVLTLAGWSPWPAGRDSGFPVQIFAMRRVRYFLHWLWVIPASDWVPRLAVPCQYIDLYVFYFLLMSHIAALDRAGTGAMT
jgi:hypothetical protein